MPDRQHAQHWITGIGASDAGQAAHLMEQVGVRKGHALGATGGSARVEQRGGGAGRRSAIPAEQRIRRRRQLTTAQEGFKGQGTVRCLSLQNQHKAQSLSP